MVSYYFVNDPIFVGGTNDRKLVNFSINPFFRYKLYLSDTNEMKNFAQTEHKYLIEQVKLSNFKGILGNETLDLQLHHPTSLMIIVPKEMM